MLESIQEKKRKKQRKKAKAVFILRSAHGRSQSCEFLAFWCKAAPRAQASGRRKLQLPVQRWENS